MEYKPATNSRCSKRSRARIVETEAAHSKHKHKHQHQHQPLQVVWLQGQQRQAGAKSTMLIGCALPFEGNQRVVGEAVFQAARMAVMDKAPALLPGVNVNLTCINSKCIDIPTYNAVYDLAERGAVAVIGEVCSGASVAAAGVSNAKKLPIISPSSTTPSLSQPDFFFRVIPSDTYQGSAVADLVSNRGLKNIGLVYEDTAYGYGLGFSFIAAFTSLGGNVPVVVMFKRGQGNVADAIRQLRAGQGSSQYPLDGAFIATGNVTFVADLLVAAQAANLELPLFGGDSSSSPELMKLIAGRPSVIGNFTVVAPSMYMQAKPEIQAGMLTPCTPGDSAFLRRFSDFVKQSNADPLAAESVFAARGYDAMTALLQAYAAAQAPKNGPAIVAALQRQNFTGVSGAIAFDRNGDLVATDRTYVFGQLTPKGAVEVEDFIDISNDGGQVAARATASAGV
ncbi:periplasmic binding protein-like I [Scenedesmus sp. NREL 46B-D3]|nr:periplasmic binding protein-like I [Scenedesmus sp. NREL 46B-D3]